MAKYHTNDRAGGLEEKWWINASGGALSLAVVLIIAVVKFTEGAWLVVVLFPLLVYALIRSTGSTATRRPSWKTSATSCTRTRRTTPGASSCSWSTATT